MQNRYCKGFGAQESSILLQLSLGVTVYGSSFCNLLQWTWWVICQRYHALYVMYPLWAIALRSVSL